MIDNPDWANGGECEKHALAFCASCKPSDLPNTVYISTGWSNAYHARRDCAALMEGQSRVEGRGGDAAPVEQTGRIIAERKDKLPCLVCLPQGRMQKK